MFDAVNLTISVKDVDTKFKRRKDYFEPTKFEAAMPIGTCPCTLVDVPPITHFPAEYRMPRYICGYSHHSHLKQRVKLCYPVWEDKNWLAKLCEIMRCFLFTWKRSMAMLIFYHCLPSTLLLHPPSHHLNIKPCSCELYLCLAFVLR